MADVQMACPLTRLVPRARSHSVQDTSSNRASPNPPPETFPPLPTSTLATTTADMAVSQEKISVHSLAGMLKSKHPWKLLNSHLATFPSNPKYIQLTPPSRPQKHLRRRHPRLPQLPLLQAIPHLNRHPPGTWLLGLLNLRRNLLLGLQARLRQHKILHRGRSRHLHTTKRRPHILDLGRRERHHLYRHQFRWRQDPDSVENGETCTNLQFDGYGMEEGREGREGREHQEAFYAVVR